MAASGRGGIAGQHFADWVLCHGGGGDVFVGDLVDEGAVGAVFEEAADEVGEQVFVGADGSVDAGAGAGGGTQDVVQAFAHAVQALEFVAVGAPARFGGQMQHGGGRVGIVAGELGIDRGLGEEFSGGGNVADIGRGLAGIDRVIGQAHDLGALDFGIPIGALDQAHHDAAVERFSSGVEPIDQRQDALAIGLDDDTEAVPTGQLGSGEDFGDDVEGEIEAVGLFGIDIEAHVRGFGGEGQLASRFNQFGHDAGALRELVAGVERGELDRNAGIVADRGGGAVGRQRIDGGHIGVEIAGGVS
ncbi:hypothetical protein FF80_00714 [Devosia sp. LC5]|nr:hypothetical protein FF80_00714 [Devosia sp. LC5]